jgi:hypothetical protein
VTAEAQADARALIRQQMQAGFTKRGMVDSGLPVLAFAIIVPFAHVTVASFVALGVGVVLAIERLVRRQPVQQAFSGLLGLGIAVLFANITGKSKGFYLPGIVETLALAAVLIVSLLVRRPFVGVIVSLLDEKCQGWRDRPVLRRAFWRVTLAASAFYLVKGGLGLTLFITNHSSSLAGVRLALGLPPYLLLLAYGFTAVKAALAAEEVAGESGAEGAQEAAEVTPGAL